MRLVTCIVDGTEVVAVEAEGGIRLTEFNSLIELIASGTTPSLVTSDSSSSGMFVTAWAFSLTLWKVRRGETRWAALSTGTHGSSSDSRGRR